MTRHNDKRKSKKIRRIKKKIQPVEGKKDGKIIKVAKDKFANDNTPINNPSVVERGKERQALIKQAKSIATRKFKVPKPQSLVELGDPKSLAEGEAKDLKLAPIPANDLTKKRKVKRKKAKKK